MKKKNRCRKKSLISVAIAKASHENAMVMQMCDEGEEGREKGEDTNEDDS